MSEIFVTYFEELFSKLSGQVTYNLTLSKRNRSFIESFLKKINNLYPNSVGEGLLWDYLVFQFRYYEGQKTRFGINIVQLNWVTGDKAIERWRRKEENWLYWNGEFILKYNINRPILEEKKDISKKEYLMDLERKRFFNTIRGFIHCSVLDLYEPYCRECIVCRYRDDCKSD